MSTFVGKVMSLLFNVLSRLVVTFLPRSKHLLISWLQSPSAVILEHQKIKSDTVSTDSPSICHGVIMALATHWFAVNCQVEWSCGSKMPLDKTTWCFLYGHWLFKKLLLFSHWVVSDSFWPHGLWHARLTCPPLCTRVCSNSCPFSQWCYLTVTSSTAPFSFCLSLSQHRDLSQ